MNTDTLVGAWFYDGMIAGRFVYCDGKRVLTGMGVCFWLEGRGRDSCMYFSRFFFAFSSLQGVRVWEEGGCKYECIKGAKIGESGRSIGRLLSTHRFTVAG